VLTVDLRNHGRSPHADEFSYDAMAADLLELLDREHISSAHLLGHSLGGKTAMHFSLLHSERIDGLIVADIAPVDYPNRHEHILEVLSHIHPEELASRQAIERELSRHFNDPSFRKFLLKGVKKHGDSYRWTFNLASIIRGYSGLQEAVLGWQPHEGPVLFLRGGESDYVQEEHLVLIRTLFPYAEIETIERAGHWIHADAPKEFGDRVMAFLDRA